MSAAPRTNDHEPSRDQISFYRQIYAGMSGANIELSTIEGDPKDRNKRSFSQGWERCASPSALARKTSELAAAGLNVYCGVSAYQRRSRRAPIVDSPVIFVDDAPDRGPLPWSLYVQTSPTSGHGYIILDTPIPADERVRLARRLAAVCGGDPSGVDAQQLIRPPGSINGKANSKGYRSWLKIDSGKRYTVAEVEAATPEVATRTRASTSATQREIDNYIATIDFDDVETRRANIEQIISPDGYAWRFTNPHGQSRQVLTGELNPKNFPALRKHEDGSLDPSMARAITIRGSIFHAYADPDIWAMQLHWGHFEHLGGSSAKSTADLKRDIGRLILKYRAELAHITPAAIQIAAHKPAQPHPEEPRRRK